jgi:hypothetical protein
MKKLFFALAVVGTVFLATPIMAQAAIDPVVAERLAFMREEEKLAHDVYTLFAGLYDESTPGARIFGRIAEAETRHTEAVLNLLVKYGLVDPASPDPGVFFNAELQKTYDTLVLLGQQGKMEALGVGVVIEQQDITDIGAAIEVSIAYADIVNVYSNLLSGSESHLAAFLQALEKPEGSGNGNGNGRRGQ